jgi:uncharacterized membrane protein
MQISSFFTLYLITIPVFAVIDLLWLGVIAKGFYQTNLGHLLGPVNWYAAVAFYLIFLAGLTYFAILPALESGSFATALMLGALYGFFTYATYDLTNMATLRDWPLVVTIVDIAWGTILGGLVASVTHTIYTVLFG